jgi:hypothetical protein
MSDNVITFPTTHEAPPKAALEPIVRHHRHRPVRGGVAFCGCLRGRVVSGGDCIDWIEVVRQN